MMLAVMSVGSPMCVLAAAPDAAEAEAVAVAAEAEETAESAAAQEELAFPKRMKRIRKILRLKRKQTGPQRMTR